MKTTVDEMTKFDIPGQPPSINSLYQVDRRTGEWTFKREAVIWRMQALPYIPKPTHNYAGRKLRFFMEVHRNWYFKNGTMLKLDLSNLEKFVHDTVARQLKFDDLAIWEKSSRKVQNVVWEGLKIEVSPFS